MPVSGWVLWKQIPIEVWSARYLLGIHTMKEKRRKQEGADREAELQFSDDRFLTSQVQSTGVSAAHQKRLASLSHRM